jgi:hypothetical protein
MQRAHILLSLFRVASPSNGVPVLAILMLHIGMLDIGVLLLLLLPDSNTCSLTVKAPSNQRHSLKGGVHGCVACL